MCGRIDVDIEVEGKNSAAALVASEIDFVVGLPFSGESTGDFISE